MTTDFKNLTPLARAAVPDHSTAFADALVLWHETLPGGGHWSGVLRRGTTLRLTDVDGRANVAALLFNHDEKTERYNMPDTLKAQHTAHPPAATRCTPTWAACCVRYPPTAAAGTTRCAA